MEYEDRITIATPEGVDLELTLAGLGSRMAALLVDTAIQWAVLVALAAALVLPFVLGPMHRAPFLVAVYLVTAALVHLAYHIFFETLTSGRTPGKRLARLRVVRADGGPIGFRDAAVRNIVRLVDGPVTGYAAGVAAILATPRNQRLGDLAAGTIVVRERRVTPSHGWDAAAKEVPEEAGAWDVTGVSDTDLAAVRRFLLRREGLEAGARARLALELARRLRPRVAGAPEAMAPERFLETLEAAKRSRG